MDKKRSRPIDLFSSAERNPFPGEQKATTMAYFSSLRPACRATLATTGVLFALAGCASVADDVTAGKAVTPAAETASSGTDEGGAEVAYAIVPLTKPGTENTPDALPAPVAGGPATPETPVSALAGARPVTGAVAAATAALAEGEADTPAPEAMHISAMEPDFDSGEPEGLEQLVATHKVVPLGRPERAASIVPATVRAETPSPTSGTPLDALISKYAAHYGIPETLLHRVVKRESRYNPKAYNRGHYGLMQIKYATARSMGYEGPAEGLFDAETNLKYAGKYLRGAWLVADDKNDGAVQLYAAGYYYHAKRKGLLEETGLR